ncbi:hypothetical protein V1264_022624 [Littorina saxatilis]|uniref:PIN domain-containing protein n=2 Tax=Littorina saxatilis TaxID=31220 RepID=A0AAN9FXS9_9CAEN
MAERDVVRITFNEIQSIVGSPKEEYPEEENTKAGDESKKKKRTKRPEQAIYRPGQLRGAGISKKEKEISNSEERAGSVPLEEENWDAELDAGRTKEATGTTDEESNRGSKENSADKEVSSGSGKDTSRCTPSPSPAVAQDKSDGGRRRSKRPDMQRYVPKSRIHEQDAEEWEEGAGGTMEVTVPSDGRDGASPRKVDLNSRLGALKVTVSAEPPSATEDESAIAQRHPPSSTPDSVNQQGRQTPPTKHRGNSARGEHNKPRQDARDGGWEGREQQGEKGDGYDRKRVQDQQSGRRDSPSWREFRGRGGGGGRHSEDRDFSHREQRVGRGGRGSEDREQRVGRGGRGSEDKEQRVGRGGRGSEDRDFPLRGRGRGRNRLLHNRSSSSESLSKSVDLGHRSQWPADKTAQQSGTFPRSKGAKSRTQTADSVDVKEDADPAPEGCKYAFSSMRLARERTGSVSSDTSGGSDLSWEDLEAEYEREKPDWNTQVEQYLEEVARQVQDSTQRLTDNIDHSFQPADQPSAHPQPPRLNHTQPGLGRNLSASSDRIFTQEYRGRKKDRRRRGSRSKNSSRESSIHSNPRDDDLWPSEEKRSQRRRNRRRHSSAGPANRVGTVEGQRAAESLRIMVGKNKEKRQVMVGGRAGDAGGRGVGGGDGQRRERQHSGSEPHKKHAEHDLSQQQRAGRGRGGGGQGNDRRRHDSNTMQPAGDSEARPHSRGQHNDNRKAQPQPHPQPQSKQQQQYNSRSQGSNHSKDSYSQHANYPRMASSPGTVPDPLPSTSHSGGLIKLPSDSPSDRPQYSHHSHGQGRGQGHRQERVPAHGQDWNQGYGQEWGQGYSQEHTEDRFRRNSQGQGPGQGHPERRLYDPKNPTKPIMVPDSRPLKFQETEDMHSPSPQESFTPPPLTHSPGPSGSPGVGPAFPPFFPPHPGYMYPLPHMRMPFPGYPHGPPPPPNHPMFYGFQPPVRPPVDADDAYYNRELEQVVSGMSRQQCRMMAEQVLRDTAPLDSQLTNILSRGQLSDDAQRRVRQLRQELQRRYERVLLLDMDVANQRGVEQLLWRSVYYNIIESLRRQQTPDNGSYAATAKQAMADILDEGTLFYENLLTKLETTYSFSLDLLAEEGSSRMEGVGRGVRLAVLSAQRTMMFLGDIARYREQAMQSTNYGKARQWYMKAQKLAPKNGRPYNQLAILAMYTRRKLDAVYFYQRSLAASNPILTARESLMSIFDEVRRKEEAVEQKRVEELRRRRRRKATPSHSQPRVELWIAPDGSSSRDHQSDRESDNDDLSSLSSIELNKRFVLTFLNVHGKLFTKINFEVFVESGSLMLQEWRLLLQHSPTMLTATRLVQISAINMFSIDNTALKDESLEASCRSLLQEHAVEVGLDMFGLLVAHVNDLLTSHLAATSSGSTSHLPLSDDLQQLLPGVKVWVDWMMCHSLLWNPQPSLRPPDIGPQVDVWKNVAQLCNTLKQLNTSHVTLHRDTREGCEALALMEDCMLSGFVPLLSAPVDTVYVSTCQDKVAVDCLRLEKVVLFGEYLCGIEPPMLSFDVAKGRYYSVAPAPVKSEDTLVDTDTDAGFETEDVIVESEESGEDGDETPGGTIKELKARKAELRQRVESQARDKHTIQTMLEESCPAKLELEVRPRFLVTDTNCFIDHLSSLRSVVATETYTLVVPLVVLNELEGLAKGAGQKTGRSHDDSPEHITMVTRHANQALTYLETEFKAKNCHLRVQTSKGSILETLAFRSEESDNSGNNDDLILSCCLHYCKDMARDFMPKDKDSPVRLFRDVVLLTDDRNLRLKAHTSNVPVKDVPAFCRWCKVT